MNGEANNLSRLFWLVLIGIELLLFFRRPSKTIFFSFLFACLSIYIASILVSSILSHYSTYSLTRAVAYIAYLLSAPIATLMVRNTKDVIHQQRIIVFTLLLSIIFSILLVFILPGFAITANSRFVGIFSYPNMTARVAVVILLFMWLLPRSWLGSKLVRLTTWFITPVMLVAIFYTGSRSNIVGVVLSYLFYLWVKYPRLRLTVVITPVLGFLAYVLFAFFYELLLGFLGYFSHSTQLGIEQEFLTLTGRTNLWIIILKNIPISLFGIGYKTLFHSQNGNLLASYQINIFGGAHNAYIEPLVETGILGLLTLFLFITRTVYQYYQLSYSTDPVLKQFALFIFTLAAFFLSQSFFEGFFDSGNIFFWLMIYFGFLAHKMVRMNLDFL